MTNEINVNQDIEVLPSAVRNAVTPSNAIDNPYAKGIIVYLDVTAVSGTGGLYVSIQGQDPVSGKWAGVGPPTATPVTATGTYVFGWYSGATNEGSQGFQTVIPRTLRVQVYGGDNSNYTYSVGASLVR